MKDQDKFSIQLQCTGELFNASNLYYQRKGEENISRKVVLRLNIRSHRLQARKESLSQGNGSRMRLPLLYANFMNDIVVKLHWELFYCVWLEVLKSKRFRRGFICWLCDAVESYTLNGFCGDNNGQIKKQCDYIAVECILADKLVYLHFKVKDEEGRKILSNNEAKIVVSMLFPINVLSINRELLWSCLLLPLIHERLSLEYILACLSTLGGAYSSLGEHSKTHAKVAGAISRKQLSIALKMNNGVLVSHCKLYYAHSLMQMGKFKPASNIIRREYTMANSDRGISDPKLISCCKAAWIKLKYLQKRHRYEQKGQDG